MDEPGQRETIRTLWEAYRDAPLSQRLLASARTLICPFERIIRHVPHGSRVLDIGCGTGALLNLLAAQARISEGVGCEINQAALTAARKAAERLGASYVIFRHALSESDWPQESFDVVALIDVMHHVPVAQQRAFF